MYNQLCCRYRNDSKYGSAVLRERNSRNYCANRPVKKHRKKNHDSSLVKTAAVAATAGTAAYLGRNQIGNVISSLSKNTGNLKSKYPNLIQSALSMKEALKTPVGVLKNAAQPVLKFAKGLIQSVIKKA